MHEKKRFQFAITIILAVGLAGCGGPREAVNTEVVPRPPVAAASRAAPPISYEQTNAALILRACSEIDAGAIAQSTIMKDARIAVASMEIDTTVDTPIIAVIEDAMIRSLKSRGFVVLERDPDMTNRHRRERANGVYLPDPGGSELRSATCLIGYRIIECGVKYYPGSAPDLVRREAVVSLSVRVEESPTGEILKADQLVGRATDELRADQISNAASFEFEFQAPGMPLQAGGSQ